MICVASTELDIFVESHLLVSKKNKNNFNTIFFKYNQSCWAYSPENRPPGIDKNDMIYF